MPFRPIDVETPLTPKLQHQQPSPPPTPFISPINSIPNRFYAEKVHAVIVSLQLLSLLHYVMASSWPSILLHQTRWIGLATLDLPTVLLTTRSANDERGSMSNIKWYIVAISSLPLGLLASYKYQLHKYYLVNSRSNSQNTQIEVHTLTREQSNNLLRYKNFILSVLTFLYIPVGILLSRLMTCVETSEIVR